MTKGDGLGATRDLLRHHDHVPAALERVDAAPDVLDGVVAGVAGEVSLVDKVYC
jgi:hypothetical protein